MVDTNIAPPQSGGPHILNLFEEPEDTQKPRVIMGKTPKCILKMVPKKQISKPFPKPIDFKKISPSHFPIVAWKSNLRQSCHEVNPSMVRNLSLCGWFSNNPCHSKHNNPATKPNKNKKMQRLPKSCIYENPTNQLEQISSLHEILVCTISFPRNFTLLGTSISHSQRYFLSPWFFLFPFWWGYRDILASPAKGTLPPVLLPMPREKFTSFKDRRPALHRIPS